MLCVTCCDGFMMLGGALSTEGLIPGGAPGGAAVGGAPDGGRNNRGAGMPVIKHAYNPNNVRFQS